jgi:putative MATE family efflux protein
MTPDERRRLILSGPILPTVVAFAAPNVMTVLAQFAVSVADGWFIGQLGTVALAAMALVFPTQMALTMMSAGAMGGGVSSSVARALGAGDRERASAAATHAIVIALGMSALFAVVFVGFGRQVYGLLGGSGAALEGALTYAHTLFLGCGAVWLANTLASILRGSGDMRTPSVALLGAAILQIPLSGALTLGIGGFSLGVAGPPAAMVATFTLSALWMGWRLTRAKAPVRLRLTGVALRWAAFRDILKVGAIACVVVVLTNATIMVVTGLIGRGGDAALAGYGAGSRLEYLMIPVAFGVGAAMTSMVGANVGARQYARAQRIAWTGAMIAGVVAALIGGVAALFPDLWLGLFTRDAAALEQGRLYLRTVGPVYGLFGMAMALYFASQGTGEMVWPVIANLARIVTVIGLGLLALDVFKLGPQALYVCVAAGICAFAAALAFSTTRRAWRPDLFATRTSRPAS